MEFEYDPDKSASNKAKHGIDFEEAKSLFSDPRLLVVKLAYPLEERWAAIGLIEDKHWTAIITYRSDHTRIISVRRSHKPEERAYDENDY